MNTRKKAQLVFSKTQPKSIAMLLASNATFFHKVAVPLIPYICLKIYTCKHFQLLPFFMLDFWHLNLLL